MSEVVVIDQIECYHPESSQENDDFENLCFPVYQEYVPNNFWYISRNKIIGHLLNKFKGDKKNYCEIGCGNGFLVKYVASKFPELQIDANDIYLEALKYAKKNNNDKVRFFQYNLFYPNINKKYQMIGCYDVLEHIEEDRSAMANINLLMDENGIAVLTVPSMMQIWSNNDVINKHKRRYTKKELKQKLGEAGFEVLYINHFMFFLYPLLWISSKFLEKKIGKNNGDKNWKKSSSIEIARFLNLKINPVLNFLFHLVLSFEFFLIKLGVKFPIGSSLICVVQKKK